MIVSYSTCCAILLDGDPVEGLPSGMAVMLDHGTGCDPDADCLEMHPKFDAAAKGCKRHRLLQRGQHWSVIDGIGNALRADDLDAAIDA